MNQTICIFFSLWILSVILYCKYKNIIYLFIPYFIFIINELYYLIYNIDIFNSKSRTSIFYDLASIPTSILKISDVNYSEGYYYDENYNISPREAENNKYERILQLLNAKEGDTILDLGCGNGSFGKYAKNKNIKVIATTLSNEQAIDCNNNGIETYVWDYTIYNPLFAGKFDHIIIIGSSEHIPGGSPYHMDSFINKYNNILKLFIMLKLYLKNTDSKIFYSGLHINPKYKSSLGYWILDRTYGGTLQLNTKDYDIFKTATDSGYTTIHKEDVTKHYYMATVMDNKHFGQPNNPFGLCSFGLFLLGFIYPFSWYMLFYGIFGYWMWMFDNNIHTYNNKNFSLKSIENRPATCWWGVFQIYN